MGLDPTHVLDRELARQAEPSRESGAPHRAVTFGRLLLAAAEGARVVWPVPRYRRPRGCDTQTTRPPDGARSPEAGSECAARPHTSALLHPPAAIRPQGKTVGLAGTGNGGDSTMELKVRGRSWSVEFKIDRFVILYILGGGSAMLALLGHGF